MITDRDKLILKWIEEYKGISISQCTQIFFANNYEGCRRRLKQLEEFGLLKSYISKLKKEKVYYQDKKLSDHDLLIYDFIKESYRSGAKLYDMKLQPRYLNDMIRPDAFIILTKEKEVYLILLEIDYTHYTNSDKFQLYEKLYKENIFQNKYSTFPILLVARPFITTKYNSKNFECIYTDLEFSNLNKFLFINQ